MWSHLRRYRGRALFGSLLMAVSVALQVAIPWALRAGFDALGEANAPAVMRAAFVLAALVVGQGVVRVGSRVTLFDVGRLVEYDVRRTLLDTLHRLGGSFYRTTGTGEIMSRATADLGNVRMMYGFALLNVVNTVCTFAFVISSMVAVSPELTLVSLATLPVLVLLVRVAGRSVFVRSRAVQEHLGKLTGRVQESLAGIRVVRAYGTEAHEIADFERLNAEYVTKNMALVAIRSFLFPLMGAVSGLGLLLTMWWGGHLVAKGEITLGSFVAMLSYLGMLAWPTAALGFVVSVVQRGQASYDRIQAILDAPLDVRSSARVTPVPEGLLRGDLEVEHLGYAHGDRAVLADVSFRVPRGGSIAIVGRTGAGKSTLAHLLPRLLPLPSGVARIGGVDLTDVSLPVLRRTIGYSPQDPFLFSTTIARNIAFGLPDPEAEGAMGRIRSAARAAQVEADILSFPDGYDTVVGERGVQLSGGQKQRIALARALVGSPEVLVLDDPLSAVDAGTERRILDAIGEAARGRTLVLVTHRCSAAARADQVLVLDEGSVVERGTHAELVAAGGLYAAFWERQRIEAELEAWGADPSKGGPSAGAGADVAASAGAGQGGGS
jgi:ATP-binding cassette subfamily B protein